MPSKNNHSGIAQIIGKRAIKRVKRPKTLCRRRETEAPSITVIADSIYKLKLQDKKAPEVYKTIGFPCGIFYSFKQMRNDLIRSFTIAQKILNKNKKSPLKKGNGCLTSIYDLLMEFKKMLPQDVKFDIEKEGGRYYLELYIYPKFITGWLYFDVKLLLQKLHAENKRLHNLFLSFLKMISFCTGISLWYQGFFGYTLEMMDERLFDMEDEYSGEDANEQMALVDFRNEKEYYENGDPKRYEKLIRKSKTYNPNELISKIKGYKDAPEIIQLMTGGCELLKDGYTLHEYHSPRHEEERDNGYFLELENQVNIIWDHSDNIAKEHEENLDAAANEGIEEPVVWIKINAETIEIDFDEMRKKAKWPEKLCEFFYNANDLIKKYLKRKWTTSQKNY